jgi:hypothetical protein
MMRIARFHDRSFTGLARAVILAVPALLLALVMTPLVAAEKPAGGAPDLMSQAPEQVAAKNANCVSCHTQTDSATMHEAEVPLACVDCHGGDISARDKEHAHVQPSNPATFTSSANPVRPATATLLESAEFVRFLNPADLRVAAETCGQSGCHTEEVHKVRRSMMTHGGSLWGAAAYNNSAVPLKNTVFGESYSPDGKPQILMRKTPPTAEETAKKGILPSLAPLPRWEISQPGNVFRIFERGGRKQIEIGNPDPQEGDPPGKPERRLSQRGFGTLNRTDPVIIGAQKTRLLDPILSMLGTNDHPGDYRSSGCSGCHVIYANDRDPLHSGPWAKFGNKGFSFTLDPTIPKTEHGHPIVHKFTRAIPSSQCIVCHIHPGTNMVMTYFGTTWWDNETDAIQMYPSEDKAVSAKQQVYDIEAANPEGSAVRGKWSAPEFLENLTDLNAKLSKTQFADFHGHGWVFRNIYKQDKKGNLLDPRGKVVAWDDPEKFKKAVHLQDIHAEKGMHCIDCHFEQDAHGNGELYGEVRNSIEIGCIDCHGSIQKYADPTDKKTTTTGPAGPNKMSRYLSTAYGARFFKKDGKLFQRSAVTKGVEWEVVQTRDTIDPDNSHYSEASRLAKTLRKDAKTWGSVPEKSSELAHGDENMTCFACHTSWMTSCFGCHLPQQANRRTPMLHNEGETLRNWTSYNTQVVRDDVFMLGKDGSVIGGRISPVRSSSALIVSSQNANREWFYVQQQTVGAEGHSGQAMNTHVPHTVRATETKVCTDCHVSAKGDNNAAIAQLLLLGTNFVNFLGRFVYVGEGEEGLEAVAVTERDEPQAVIGSELHRFAYPSRYRAHVEEHHRRLEEAYEHPGNDIGDLSWLVGHGSETRSLQLRGEYLYAANGRGGLRVYDVAFIDQKGFSERIVTAPVSPLGQRLYVSTKEATAVASPTTLAVDPYRSRLAENEEQPIHPMYKYIFVTDREEGLILVDAGTLSDGNPENNFLERALTFNPNGQLSGAENITLIGTYAYIATDHGLVVVDLGDPMNPKITDEIGAPGIDHPVAIANQFRYAFILDRIGLKVLDITDLAKPRVVEGAIVPLADAHDVYVARTYAYVAAGRQGLAIIDVERPEHPKLDQTYDADGELNDSRAVKVGMTNASVFAYVADGHNGLRVLQLTSPERTPGNFGFSPRPQPRLIATYHTHGPAIALSKGLDRDRGVDESGNQLVVFGRRGGRPFNHQEMQRMYMRDGKVFTVTDGPPEGGKEIAFREVAARPIAAKAPAAPKAERPAREQPGVRLKEQSGVRLKQPEGGVRLRSEP